MTAADMASGLLPALKPLPLKERISVLFVERGEIDTFDGAFVVVDATGVRTHIPVGGVACIMPGLDSRRPCSPRERE